MPESTSPSVTLLHLALPIGGRSRARTETVLSGQVAIETAHGLFPMTRLLIEELANVPVQRGLLAIATPDPLALLALRALHRAQPAHYFHLDRYLTDLAQTIALKAGASVEIHCAPDLPEFSPAPDLALMQTQTDDEAGLTLEYIRQARTRLAPGGKLAVTINNMRDKWLREQLERTFGNVTLAARNKHGLLYLAKKHEKTTAEPDPANEHFFKRISFELDGATQTFTTSYGVFTSDNLDEGSRALLDVLTPPAPCEAILDLGCGWGPLGILAARRTGAKTLTMIDANARAVELAKANASAHGLDFAEIRHEAGAESLRRPAETGRYHLVVSNPPYSTEFRVSELFLRAALLALRPGGQLWVVAKRNPVLLARMDDLFGNVTLHTRRGYEIYQSIRKVGG